MLAAAALISVTVSACGGDETATPAATGASQPAPSPGETLAPATLRAGQKVPAPTATPLLTLTGKIGNKNSTAGLTLDPALLDELGVVRVEVYDPWAKGRLSFRGVWLADLLNVAGVKPAASGVHMTALDDYEVDLTMDEIHAGGIFVATKNGDGSKLPVDKGGPVRLIFRDGTASGENPDQWIWSLASIDVR